VVGDAAVMSDSYLKNLVKAKVIELGDDAASDFFEVSKLLVQQWRNGSKHPSLAAVERVFENLPPAAPSGADWEGKQVAILQPFYKAVHPLTHFALLGMFERGKMGALMQHGDAFIGHARNKLADQFLKTGLEWSFWIDDDIIPPIGNAAWYNRVTGFNLPDAFAGKHALNALRNHKKSLVGCLYFGRSPTGKGMYYEALLDSPEGQAENARLHAGPREELRQTRWCATGALLVHRQVYLDIQKAYPNLAPQHPSEPWHFFSNASDAVVNRLGALSDVAGAAMQEAKAGKLSLPGVESIFADIHRQIAEARTENLRDSRLQMGEDQIFGIRAGKAGHPSFVDLSVVCGHVGSAIYGPGNTR